MEALKAFMKTFEAPKKNYENKNSSQFLFYTTFWSAQYDFTSLY